MRIVLYNGNLKPPHFVNLLAEKMAEGNDSIYLAGTANRLFEKRESKLILLPTDSNSKVLLTLHLLMVIFKMLLFKTHYLFKFVRILLKSKKHLKIKLKQFLIWSKFILVNADIIHIQWVSHIILFEEILESKLFKIVVSFRGRLVNVSPYVDEKYKKSYQKELPKVDGIHAVSKNIAFNLQKLGITEPHSKVIYSGLDLNNIPIKNNYERKGSIQILSVGRVNWIKGYKYALYAIKELLNKKVTVHYTIVAGGKQEELLFIIDQLKLNTFVTLIDELEHSAVLDKIKKADLFLLPSISEGLANVVLEAMAIGTPVLSSDCGGMPEVIEDGKTGWLFKNRDVDDMVSKIENFINTERNNLKPIIKAAKEKVKRQHNLELMSSKMLNFYNEL